MTDIETEIAAKIESKTQTEIKIKAEIDKGNLKLFTKNKRDMDDKTLTLLWILFFGFSR